MRGSLAGLVIASVLVLGASSAAAEGDTVVAKDGATVYLKPGESSKVVVKVKSGQEMTVVRRDGRWLKVRVKGRTGFIPRTKVSGDAAEEEVVERQTRRRPYVDGRSTDRGWGGEPPEDRRGADAVDNSDGDEPEPEKEPNLRAGKPDRVAARDPEPEAGGREPQMVDDEPAERPRGRKKDADEPEASDEPKREKVRLSSSTQLRSKPGAKSRKVAAAPAGDYFLVEERNGWARIENEDGERGWVSSKLLVDEKVATAGKRVIAVGAKIGFTAITQGTRTAGGAKGIPDNYNLSTSGVGANLGGSYAMPIKGGDFYVGGELNYAVVKALPGINYLQKTTGITTHSVDLTAIGGYNLRNSKGMVAWGRLGYHYDVFAVADVTNLDNNTAKLPSESLSGLTLGAALTAPTITPKIGALVAIDALVAGSRAQTKNLEDGASPSAFGLWFGLGGNYRLSRRMTIDLGYRLGYVSNSFGAPLATSVRGHMGTSVTRVDVAHSVGLGVSQAF
jgi:uncharacterized protein YgiM (DUF1202 family)